MITDIDIISLFIKSNGHINISRLKNISDEYREYLLSRYVDSLSLLETIKRILFNIEKRPVCEICGKPVTYIGRKDRLYTQTCSQDCTNKLNAINVSKAFSLMSSDKKQEIVNKVKNTKLLKYGDENFCNIEKIKETCLKRYGVEHPLLNEVFKEKMKKTCLEQYGVEYTGLIQSKIDKTRLTCLKRYGVECPLQNHSIQQLALNTSIERYACDKDKNITNVFLLLHVKNKIKNTCLERYGVENISLNNKIKQKISNALLSDEVKEKIYKTKKENKSFNISKLEDICYSFLLEKYSDCIRQYNSELYPFNCDFYIPSEDLYIEYNGSHYHHYHPYDSMNNNDNKELKCLIEKANILRLKNPTKKNLYDFIIYTWTDLDVRKRNIAKLNNLNYIEFWNIDELKNWLIKK